MRRKRFKNRGKKFSKYYRVSRGGIQLSVALVIGFCVYSCTLKHKILPTSIDVNSIEVITDSISPDDKYLIFN